MATHIQLVADAGAAPDIREVGGFITDLMLLYELEFIRPPDADETWKTPTVLLSRNGRSVPEEARLRVEHLSLASPLRLRLLVPALHLGIKAAELVVAALDPRTDAEASRPEPDRVGVTKAVEAELVQAQHQLEKEQAGHGVTRLPGERRPAPATRPLLLVRERLGRSFPVIEIALIEDHHDEMGRD